MLFQSVFETLNHLNFLFVSNFEIRASDLYRDACISVFQPWIVSRS
jgi:hypothetical protein